MANLAKKQIWTHTDRKIISTIINRSDFPYPVTPEDFQALWIDCGTVVIKLTSGYARFNSSQFRELVALVKAELQPEGADERNERIHKELKEVCNFYGLTYGQIDWVNFSTTLHFYDSFVGHVGCNSKGYWYARRRERANNHYFGTGQAAIAAFGLRPFGQSAKLLTVNF